MKDDYGDYIVYCIVAAVGALAQAWGSATPFVCPRPNGALASALSVTRVYGYRNFRDVKCHYASYQRQMLSKRQSTCSDK